jgi:hypothetical protein
LVILIIFLIAYYFLFLRKKTVIIEEEKIIEFVEPIKIDYEKLITDIEQNISSYDKDIFYKKVDKILRLYLEEY